MKRTISLNLKRKSTVTAKNDYKSSMEGRGLQKKGQGQKVEIFLFWDKNYKTSLGLSESSE